MNTQEMEINLINLLVYVVKGWRAVIVWMVLMALVVGGVQYLRATSSYEAQLAKQQEQQEMATEEKVLTVQEQIAEVEAVLTQNQQDAVDKLLQMEVEYERQLDYYQTSLLMTMDPFQVTTARLQYLVDAPTDKGKAYDIMYAYMNSVRDNTWQRQVQQEIGDPTEYDLTELISYTSLTPAEVLETGKGSVSFQIIVKYTDEESLRQIVTALETTIVESQSEIEAVYGRHRLVPAGVSYYTTADADVYSLLYNRRANMLTLESNITNAKKAFTEDQTTLYNLICEKNGLEIIEEEEEAAVEEVPTLPASAPGISVKYVLVGAILGAFLVCMWRAVIYIFNGKLKAEDDVAAFLGVPVLCNVEGEQKKKFFGWLDAWIDSFMSNPYRYLTKEQQIQMAVSNIVLYCEKEGRKSISFNSSVNYQKEAVAQIISMLEKRGITVQQGYSILQDAVALEEMSHADGVVFLECVGGSRYEDIRRELQMCQNHEIAVIGLVTFA